MNGISFNKESPRLAGQMLPKDIKKRKDKIYQFKFIVCLILSNLCTFLLFNNESVEHKRKLIIPQGYVMTKLPLILRVNLHKEQTSADLFSDKNTLVAKEVIITEKLGNSEIEDLSYNVYIKKSQLQNIIQYKDALYAYPANQTTSQLPRKTRRNYELSF